MKYIKLFESFNNDKVKYFVNRVGSHFRIFALTPKMMADGLTYKDAEDAEELFGKGSLWTNYDSYEEVENIIKSLDSDEYEPEEGDSPDVFN
jgi:hypothetical protein